jgi:hypothetical protein
MPKGMQPIFSQTLSSTASITFNNIPQTYTSLLLVAKARSAYTVTFADGYIYFQDGAGTSNYSATIGSGNGSTGSSYRYSSSGTASVFGMNGAAHTSNAFSSFKILFPNYRDGQFKQMVSESVCENDAASAIIRNDAGLWRSAAPITQINMTVANAFVAGSVFTLYGITRA